MKFKLVTDDYSLMGSILPRWYGFAYRLPTTCRTVLCIIPLNLIVRYAYKFYWFIYRWVKSSGWQDKLDDAYRRGYTDGNATRR